MELRSIEPKDPGIIFDLLKGWISDSFHRRIKDSTPPGCPWQALASALQESIWQQCRNRSSSDGLDAEKRYTELDVREGLVNIYMRQTEGVRRAIAQAKLEDPLSIFSLGRYQNAQEVMDHWDWYLSCLCGAQEELEVMRMPLDFVDLKFLSMYYRARITVSRFSTETIRFLPDGANECSHFLHLMMHAGLWASLLGPRLPEFDKGKVLGAVVELANNLQDALEAFAGRSACIVSFDADKQCYMACVGQNLFPVERAQIKRIWCHHSDAETGTDAWSGWQANLQGEIRRGRERERRKLFDTNWGPGPGQAPVLRGIPDGAFEFQLLFELVGKEAQKRLQATRDELAGRAGRQKQYAPTSRFSALPELSRQSAASQSTPLPSSNLFAGLVKLTEAVKKLKDQHYIWAICPNTVKPPADFAADLLDCNAYDELRLAGVHGDLNVAGTVYLLAAKASEVNTSGCALRRRTDGDVDKWISSDSACIWIANHDHKPDPAWGERFIELKANDKVVMTKRETGSWEGWATGFVRNHNSQGSSYRLGYFPISFVTPHIWLAKQSTTTHVASEG